MNPKLCGATYEGNGKAMVTVEEAAVSERTPMTPAYRSRLFFPAAASLRHFAIQLKLQNDFGLENLM
jgi:hypothetical protein